MRWVAYEQYEEIGNNELFLDETRRVYGVDIKRVPPTVRRVVELIIWFFHLMLVLLADWYASAGLHEAGRGPIELLEEEENGVIEMKEPDKLLIYFESW